MKKIITLLLLSLFVNQEVHAQNYLPVATSGYTMDAIAENTTAIATTYGALDGVNVLYSKAHANLIGSLYGVPNNGLISAATKTFQLQNYNGPNMLLVPAATQDSLSFLTPVACQSLSILDFATDAFTPATMSVTIRFTDNSTQVFPSITVYDWLYTLQPSFASGFDRMNRTTGTPANEGGAGNPRFFTNDFAILCANQSKMVKRIIFRNTSTGTTKLCILAVAATENPLTVSAAPAGICNAGTAMLTATGLTSYTWLPVGSFAGSNAGNVSVSLSGTTEYTVQAVTPLNCVVNAVITVNVYTGVPVLTLTNTANAGGICPTATINLNAAGAVTYTWSGGSTAITNGVSFAPATGGNYTVTGENACGISTAVTSVSIHPLPTVNPATSASTLCAGGTISLTATGNATNYVWSGGTAPAGNGAGFIPAAGNFTYNVIGTSALSCTALATVPVTVYATPNAAPVASATLGCIGNSVTLTAGGALSYTWASSTQTLTGNPQFTVIPAAPGVTSYTVTKSNSTCVDTKVISITTNSLPTVFATASPTQVCALRPSTLSVTGGISYTWTAPANATFTGAGPVVYPASAFVYSVAASDGTCISRTTVPVSTLANPTITASSSSPSICAGQPVTLSALGGINYTWTATTGTFYTASVTDTPTTAIAYNVTGNNASGCTSTAQQFVLVSPSPVMAITVSAPDVCSGDPSILTATGANTYAWDAAAGSATTNSVVVNPVSPISDVITYTVHGSFPATGCQSSQTVQVSVFVPTIIVSSNTAVCSGANVIIGADVADSYLWSNGSIFQNITVGPTLTTVYTITASISNVNGLSCLATNSVQVVVNPKPVITATSNYTVICRNTSAILTASGAGTAGTYTWIGGPAAVTSQSMLASPSATQNYSVSGIDANGCRNNAVYQLAVAPCTGIAENTTNTANISIYPNPNNGEFTIRAEGDINLVLVNELGEVIQKISLLNNNEQQVSLSGLPTGIYFLYGQTGTTVFSRKIIVTK